MAKPKRYDPASLLALEKAHVVAGGHVGVLADPSVTLRWKVALGAIEECRAWLAAERRILTDFSCETKSYDGVWRTVGVVTSNIAGEIRQFGHIEHTLAKGWITTLLTKEGEVDWTNARWGAGRALPGNSKDADGVAGTASDDPEHHITIEFPFCDPTLANSLAAQFTQSSYSAVAVSGVEQSGTWHRIYSTWRIERDGSATVIFQLAKPQYTLEAYRDFGTAEAKEVFYLWGVPKDISQTILDAWKSEPGRSATASYGGEGLVDLVLISKPDSPLNLSTDPIKATCDSEVTYHFAWGYTEAQLGVFLAAHGGATQHNGDSGALDWSGRTRVIRVSTRGDGLFDAVVEERHVEFDEDKHVFSIALVSGTTVVRTVERGWNAPMSRLDSLKATYETAAIGTITRFEVTRSDDCTFDYVGEVVVEDDASVEFRLTPIASGGVGLTVVTATGQTQADLNALANEFKPAPRKRVTADIQLTENTLANVRAAMEEVQRSVATLTAGTEDIGWRAQLKTGHNVEANELANVLASAAGQSLQVSLTPHDDKTFSYNVLVMTPVKTEDNWEIAPEALVSPNEGIRYKVYRGKNVTLGELDAVISGLATYARETLSIDVQPGDNGGFDYRIQEVETQPTEAALSIPVASKGAGVRVLAGNSVDLATINALIVDESLNAGARKSYSINLTPHDDGSCSYVVEIREVVAATATAVVGSRGITQTHQFGSNQDALPTIAPPAQGEVVEITANIGDDGTVTYHVVRSQQTRQQKVFTAGTYAQRLTVTDTVGDTSAPPVLTPAVGLSYTIRANVKPDGSVDWQSAQITREGITSAPIALANVNPWYQRGGYSETATVFEGETQADMPAPTATFFAYRELQVNEDFTFSGVLHEFTYNQNPADYAFPSGDIEQHEWQFQEYLGVEQARKMTYLVQHASSTRADQLVSFLNGSIASRSHLGEVSIYGALVFHAVRVTLKSIGSWANVSEIEL